MATPALLLHQAPLALDRGDNAWMLVSTVLVLFMTLPGLALFYGGMVRKKNILATMAQSIGASVVVAILWALLGYSLAFGVGGGSADSAINKIIGGFQAIGLMGITVQTAHKLLPSLPEFTFFAFQMTFAIITPAVIAGSLAERMKFSAFILFCALWCLLVYVPICHWVWGGGFLGQAGVLDFAGGFVIEINSGIAGLVTALVLGKRKGFGRENMAPHNLAFTMVGAALLLVGWIGFNAGSAGVSDGLAAVATVNTILAAMTGAAGWVIPEWMERKQPTLLGMASGLVAGLVGITPAAGFVAPLSAMFIGLVAGGICFFASTYVKNYFKYDDSLDVFGVHGIGGMVGVILTAVLADKLINPLAATANVGTQFMAMAATVGWSGLGTFLVLMVCRYTTGLRVSDEAEIEGLDQSQHGEVLHS